jgi:hypothetical protein
LELASDDHLFIGIKEGDGYVAYMAMQGFDLFCSKREGLLDNGFSLLLHTNAFVTLKLLVYLEALEAGKESSSYIL